jgi:NDP-sugar pyrophosphorylase family protein
LEGENMHIIIPMAGSGERFVAEGYTDPKPLIKVGGKHIIEYVCDMFDRDEDEFTFICNDKHLETTGMRGILENLVKHANVVSMPVHKLGPVFTILAFDALVYEDEPVIVTYCDTPIIWDYNNFKLYIDNYNVDGCIVSHTDFHPHTLNSTLFAYSKLDKQNRVLEIKEKSCYTNNKFKEHASSGTYYFRHGGYIKKYFKQLVEKDINYNGEYYVTLVYNLLIKDKLKVYSYLTDFVLSFGKPDDIRNFEAWQIIINGGQVKDVYDVMRSYEYWSKYNNQC